MISAHDSAQIALGKFYLHRWEGQVLVDWATSMLGHGYDADALIALSEMEGSNRAAQLDQFIFACGEADIEVIENMELAIRAYIEDLRRRVLAQEIDINAAFAQLRPLAYDNTSVVIPGLTELDEDFNLLDSQQSPFHHEDITLDDREEFLLQFFEGLTIEDGPWNQAEAEQTADHPHQPSAYEQDAARFIEIVAIIFLVLLSAIYLFLVLGSLAVNGLPDMF